jgi:hypothetical protein
MVPSLTVVPMDSCFMATTAGPHTLGLSGIDCTAMGCLRNFDERA